VSPEAPGNLVVLDLTFRRGTLTSRVEQVVPPSTSASGFLRATFHEAAVVGFDAVGRGVAFVRKPPDFEHSLAEKATDIPSLGSLCYEWTNVALGDGLMLILVLPKGYTIELVSTDPLPRSAKRFNKRLAVYFKPHGSHGDSVKVRWGLKQFAGELRSEAERIRSEIVRRGDAPNNSGVDIDEPSSVMAEFSRTGKMMQTTIYNTGGTVIVGSQNFQVTNQSGDIEGLLREVAKLGFQKEELEELRRAVIQDKSEGQKPNVSEGKTGKWFAGALKTAAKGAVKVSVDVVASVITKALEHYATGG